MGTRPWVLLVVASACSTQEIPPLPEDDVQGGCVVARGDGFVLRVEDALELRKRFVPPPDRAAARRLALDVWLAEWIATGSIGHAPLPAKIGHHNALVNRGLDDRIAALADARARLHVELGPCWSPAKNAGPAG